ncbi:unnamed protein product [Lasius platythorax]|uniref:Uncharacterized protein n=1 Tax=Lasius platythorax TaxID=488582 RepID=A0AAV2NTS9_9HYME
MDETNFSIQFPDGIAQRLIYETFVKSESEHDRRRDTRKMNEENESTPSDSDSVAYAGLRLSLPVEDIKIIEKV